MLRNKATKLALLATVLLAGCATQPPKDYTAFRAADPKTILVLPPKNSSPEVGATYGTYSTIQQPIAEAGYYVLPITLVDEHFKTNGLTVSDEMHLVETGKLREVFGADAALYVDIKDYGTKYFVIGSATVVRAQGRLVDLRTGQELWSGEAQASSEEGKSNNNSGGLVGLLITALVNQVLATTFDQGFSVARIANNRLLAAGTPNGLIYGPRHPQYRK